MRAWARAGASVGAIGACLLLAACQGKSDQERREAGETPLIPKASQLPDTAAADPSAPLGASGVDAALAAVRAYNERAARELAALDQHEAKIRAAAARAMEAARSVDGAAEAQRQTLTSRVSAARREADTARNLVVDGQSRLRRDIDDQITSVEAMLETCGKDEALSQYAGCQALEVEHELLLKNIDTLTARYQAADLAYGAERAKLEEASAAVALAVVR